MGQWCIRNIHGRSPRRKKETNHIYERQSNSKSTSLSDAMTLGIIFSLLRTAAAALKLLINSPVHLTYSQQLEEANSPLPSVEKVAFRRKEEIRTRAHKGPNGS
ncbi:uncharacterized protein ACIQIH_013942 isoform 1-T1 [Cyanocitta cristata]